LGKNRI
jgi:Fe-S-cluster containining protein